MTSSNDMLLFEPPPAAPVKFRSLSRDRRRSLLGLRQVTCAMIALAVFLVLILIAGSTVLAWSVFCVVLVLLCSEVLALSMPSKIRQRLVANCIRGDGTWSMGRASVERKAIADLKLNLVVVLSLCLAPSLFGLWWFNREVIPLGLGADAIASISIDPEQWKSNLRDEGERFDRWKKNSKTGSSVSADQHRQILWNFWPVIVLSAVLWLCIVASIVAKYYIYCLKGISNAVHQRANDYRWVDLSRQTHAAAQASIAVPAKSNTAG